MRIASSIHQSSVEQEGKIMAVIFVQGCDLYCDFCHNKDLINFKEGIEVSPQELYEQVIKDNFLLDGVLVSGGEPTLQRDLHHFFSIVKENRPMFTELNTNGTNPGEVFQCLPFLDMITIDLKPYSSIQYIDLIAETIRYVEALANQAEYRMVVMRGLSKVAAASTAQLVEGSKWPLVLVKYKAPWGDSEHVFDSPMPGEMENLKKYIENLVNIEVKLR